MRHRVNLLDTWVDRVSISEVGERINAFIRAGTPHQVVPANVDFLRLGHENPCFRDLVNAADLVVADGMPLVWAARFRGDPLPHRISGVELIHECARLAEQRGYSIFFLGAAPGIADEAAAVLRARYPRLRIAGSCAPPPLPLSATDDARVVNAVRAARPDILLVAFGAPRQEHWIRAHMARLNVPVCIGVGGAFDMISGRIRRAPLWMQRAGLEWLFRVLLEPRRLWRRYFVHDLPIFARLMIQSRALAPGAMAAPDRLPDTLLAYDPTLRSTREAIDAEESNAHIA